MPTPELGTVTQYNGSADVHSFSHTGEDGYGLLVVHYCDGNSSASTVSYAGQSLSLIKNEVCAWRTANVQIHYLTINGNQGTGTVEINVAGTTARNVIAFAVNTLYVGSCTSPVTVDDNVSRTDHDLPAMDGTSNDRLLGLFAASTAQNATSLQGSWAAPNGTLLATRNYNAGVDTFRALGLIEETSTTGQVITGQFGQSRPATGLGIKLTGVTQAAFKRQFFPVN